MAKVSMDAKLDKVLTHVARIDVTLAKQEVQLSEHIRRTKILEEKLEPVEVHVQRVNGAIKLILLIAACSGLIALALHL